MRKPPRPESFEKFYYTKVGLGEGCGCAERIIDVHEHDRLGTSTEKRPYQPRRGIFARLFGRRTVDSTSQD